MEISLTSREAYNFVMLCYGELADPARSPVFSAEYFEATVPEGGYVFIRAQDILLALAKVRLGQPHPEEAPRAWIDLLCVHPNFRGKKFQGASLADLLLDDAIAAITRQAPEVDIVEVETTSEAAKKVYLRHGFILEREYNRVGWGCSSVFKLLLHPVKA